jgi:hypothetical protein
MTRKKSSKPKDIISNSRIQSISMKSEKLLINEFRHNLNLFLIDVSSKLSSNIRNLMDSWVDEVMILDAIRYPVFVRHVQSYMLPKKFHNSSCLGYIKIDLFTDQVCIIFLLY